MTTNNSLMTNLVAVLKLNQMCFIFVKVLKSGSTKMAPNYLLNNTNFDACLNINVAVTQFKTES